MQNTRGKFKTTELKYVSIYSKCIESKDVMEPLLALYFS